MKKINFLSFLCVSFFIFFSLCIYQALANSGWNKHVWSDYQIQFFIPADFEIKEKTNNIFQAQNSSMFFSMSPWNFPKTNEKDMAKFALKTLKMDYKSSKLSYKEIKLKNLKGYEISGVGKDSEGEKKFIVMGLTDPKGAKDFTCYVIFHQNMDLEIENTDKAMHLIDSIYKKNK